MAQRRKTLPRVPPKEEQGTRTLLDALKEIVETGEGVRGDPLDRKLTLRDLVDSGIARLKRGAGGGTQNGYVPGIEPPPPNLNTPPQPSGLVAAGSFNGRIIITWDKAQDAYGNHAFTNVYRSEEDNFANAELVGREVGFLFTDYARDDATDPDDPTHLKGYFYWITFTSSSGVEGPPNSGNGTYAEPIPDVGYLLELLSKNLDDEPADLGSEDETLILHAKRFAIRTGPDGDLFYPLIIAEVGGVQTVVIDTALIRDGSIQEGQLGPITIGKIEAADGSPITTVDGLIRAEAIDADNLSVAQAATFYGVAQSNNFDPGKAGWRLEPTGGGEINFPIKFSNVTETEKLLQAQDFANGRNLLRRFGAITSSGSISNPSLISDGVRSLGGVGTYAALASGRQHMTCDLGKKMFIGESRIYFYNLDGRRYRYAIAVSETGGNDWEFVVGWGPKSGAHAGDLSSAGSGMEWSRSAGGGGSTNSGDVFPTIDGVSMVARYVRVFVNGSTSNTGNHLHEWELWNSASGYDPYADTLAKRGNHANNLANKWTRPGSTLINGNQIFTGDAYVDTLQIKGNAITANIGNQSTGEVQLTSSSTYPPSQWHTIFSVHQGSSLLAGRAIVTARCKFRYRLILGSQTSVTLHLKLRVLDSSGRQIDRKDISSNGNGPSGFPYSSVGSTGGSLSLIGEPVITGPVWTGPYRIQFWWRLDIHNSNGYSLYLYMSNRFLSVFGARR